MSFTFANDHDINHPLTGGTGFVGKAPVNTSAINDIVGAVDYHVCNKMATSIPTIFSRMFLFDAAYEDVATKEKEPELTNMGHEGYQTKEGFKPSIYHYLISEHLDMLEFIYKYADNNDFHIKYWDASTEAKNLLDSRLPEIETLGNAIEIARKETPALSNFVGVYLFYYGKVVLGGTSPRGLIFTNPNWRRLVEEEYSDLDHLFGSDSPRPLHERDFELRKLLYLQYKIGHLDARRFPDNTISDDMRFFREYIDQDFENYDSQGQMHDWFDGLEDKYPNEEPRQRYEKELSLLGKQLETDNNRNVFANNTIPIYRQNDGSVIAASFKSEYIITPTQSEYQHEVGANGEDYTLPHAPLLLPEGGIEGAIFYDTDMWDNSKHKVPTFATIADVPLSRRKLPGKNKEIPFITIDDLLEDHIIELPYALDKNNFVTCMNGDMRYLLPIKKAYFRFFGIEDLKRNLVVSKTSDGDYDKITVKLTIPLQGGRSFDLVRNYSTNDNAKNAFPVVDCRKSNPFNIGIYPFFKMKNEVEDLNIFQIMLGYSGPEVSCNFYKMGAIEGLDNKGIDFTSKHRTETSSSKLASTTHMRLNSRFDFIVVHTNGNRLGEGLLIPSMREVEKLGATNFVFAVDFGTSNTHIAWTEKNNGTVKPFTIAKGDPMTLGDAQLVFLDDYAKSNTFTSFREMARREFPPVEIGMDSYVKFPMRTAMYERENLRNVNTPEMFLDFNVGFNFSSELDRENLESNHYETDLKWNTRDAKAQSRIKAYCKQLLWLIRNKALLNGGNNNFELVITYPHSMRRSLVANYKNAWKSAQEDLGNSGATITDATFKIESVAPYFCARAGRDGITQAAAFMNIDIGGGSTDIFYYNPRTKNCQSFSFNFAANDLWGAGNDPVREHEKDNGFISAYIQRATDDNISKVENYKNLSDHAYDVVSFLFGRKDMSFIDTIRSSQVINVIVVHFAAIMYYVTRILDVQDVAVPRYFSFTGMGSKYLDIISSDKVVIERMIAAILEYTRGEQYEVEVIRNDNPKEVTAEGAITMMNTALLKDMPRVENAEIVLGIHGEADDPAKYKWSSIINKDADLRKKIIKQVKDFIDMMNDSRFINSVSDCDFELCMFKDAFSDDNLESSIDNGISTLSDSDRDKDVNDALFFWPLKDCLYKAGNNVAKAEGGLS